MTSNNEPKSLETKPENDSNEQIDLSSLTTDLIKNNSGTTDKNFLINEFDGVDHVRDFRERERMAEANRKENGENEVGGIQRIKRSTQSEEETVKNTQIKKGNKKNKQKLEIHNPKLVELQDLMERIENMPIPPEENEDMKSSDNKKTRGLGQTFKPGLASEREVLREAVAEGLHENKKRKKAHKTHNGLNTPTQKHEETEVAKPQDTLEKIPFTDQQWKDRPEEDRSALTQRALELFGIQKYLKKGIQLIHKKERVQGNARYDEMKRKLDLVSKVRQSILDENWKKVDPSQKINQATQWEIADALKIQKEVREEVERKKETKEITKKNTNSNISEVSKTDSDLVKDSKKSQNQNKGKVEKEENQSSQKNTSPTDSPTPLKTSYEAALDRIAEKERNPQKDKENPIAFSFEAKDDVSVLSNEEEVENFGSKIKDTKSFEELIEIFESIKTTKGSPRWFSKMDLIGRLYLVQAGKVTLEYVKSAGGLRDKVKELLSENGPVIYRPIDSTLKESKNPEPMSNPTTPTSEIQAAPEKQNLETPEEKKVSTSPTPPNTEAEETKPKDAETPVVPPAYIPKESVVSKDEIEKKSVPPPLPDVIEKEVRNEVYEILNSKSSEELESLNNVRVAYCNQLRQKTQREHTNSRINRLLRSLKIIKTETSENFGNFEKAEQAYTETLNRYKTSLDDNREALLAAEKLGSRGLEIVQEMKNELTEKILRQVLILEKKFILEAVGKGLSEKDNQMINKLVSLKGKKSFFEKVKEVFTAKTTPEKYEY